MSLRSFKIHCTCAHCGKGDDCNSVIYDATEIALSYCKSRLIQREFTFYIDLVYQVLMGNSEDDAWNANSAYLHVSKIRKFWSENFSCLAIDNSWSRGLGQCPVFSATIAPPPDGKQRFVFPLKTIWRKTETNHSHNFMRGFINVMRGWFMRQVFVRLLG